MWLRLPNGRNELVVNEDHVRRLLDDGAVEIPDPRSQPEPSSLEPVTEESEQSLASTDPEEEVTLRLPAQKKQLLKRATKSAKE